MEVLIHPQSYPDTNKSTQNLWVNAPFFKKFTTGLGIFNPNMQEAKNDLHETEVSLIYKEVTDHQELHSETMSLKEKRKETYYPTKTKHILKNKEFLKEHTSKHKKRIMKQLLVSCILAPILDLGEELYMPVISTSGRLRQQRSRAQGQSWYWATVRGKITIKPPIHQQQNLDLLFPALYKLPHPFVKWIINWSATSVKE